MRTLLALAVMAAGAVFAQEPGQQSVAAIPKSYPRSYAVLVNEARAEGRVVLYSAADTFDTASLAADFRRAYPGIAVEISKLHTVDLNQRYLAEIASGRDSADILISSAMDLQIKLVNDGYSQPYASPEKPQLPAWAVWKNEAYGVSAEPIVFVYNKALLAPKDVPQSHIALEHLLNVRRAEFSGKVAMYDPERSAAGFLYLSQDLQVSRDTSSLVRAIGATSPYLSTSGASILQRVSTGEALIAYNMNGAYALERQAGDPGVGVVFPSDYTLVMARIAFISREARHPAAAKVFLDYLLSARGQRLLSQLRMTPVRADVPSQGTKPATESMRAIHVGPSLLASLDQLKQRRILAEWRAAIAPRP